ncbi:MAG: hypothetical protein R3244_13340 [Thermoanaerobaculia bacterium]|nr:hypothetical protein [Thermoanaerobaculia bacterium]
MRARFETTLAVLSFGCWSIGLLAYLGLLPLAGALDLDLQVLFAAAAAVGWLSGNVYVQRSRGVARVERGRLILIYLLGPPGALFLIRSLASVEHQAAAPLASVYAFGVYAVLFLVPVSLRRAFRSPS